MVAQPEAAYDEQLAYRRGENSAPAKPLAFPLRIMPWHSLSGRDQAAARSRRAMSIACAVAVAWASASCCLARSRS
jgi:hypothetical protein